MKHAIGKIAEIIDGDRGKNYPKLEEFSENGFCLFLNTGNVTPCGFSFENNQFITQEKDAILRKGKIQRRDIVYTTRGTVGNAAYYGKNVPYEHVRINSGMVILRCYEEKVYPPFLFQILKSESCRTYFKKFCTGSAQPQLPIKILREIELEIPALDAQKRIAATLSAYDELIENNKKQIKLLEEAAQRLYKEWFVDLRFPGYENVPVVDGVPEGWERRSIGDICTLRKENVSPSSVPEDTPYIGLEHMPKKDFCLSTWACAGEVASNKFIYKENDIIFGKIRPYFHKVGFALTDGVASTDSIIMLAKKETFWSLLLMTVFSDDFVSYSYQNCKEGAKMPRADWNVMKEYPVLIPSERVLNGFERSIRNIAMKIKKLALQNIELSESHELLLPKLMSGELEV